MQSKIRVLHIITKLSFGGVQSVIMNYYRNIDRSKIQFDFVVQDKEKHFFDNEITKLGGKIYILSPMHTKKKQFENELFTLLKEHPEYKIIHVHQNFLNIIPLSVAKKANIPVRISHSHSNYPASSLFKKIQRSIFRLLIGRYATDYFACSKISAEWLYGEKKARGKKCKIIYNAIDVSKFIFNSDTRNKIRKELQLDEDTVLLHVGMFTDAKNHEYLLEIFKNYKILNPFSKLLLIGDGEKKEDLIKIAKEYNVLDSVVFLGKINDVEKYLMAADHFIFPSKYEGLGMSLIEAQISGLKCWSSDVLPKEVDLFDEVSFLSINTPAEVWAKSIFDHQPKRYLKSFVSICNSGYEIKMQAERLTYFYFDVSK